MTKPRAQTSAVNLLEGTLTLYDYCRPSLPSGNWRLESTQQVTWNAQELDQSYSKQQAMVVEGPRFSIAPSDVYSVHPPANSSGLYSNILPHIVMTKRTLPWERYSQANNQLPWMTLLLVEDLEFVGASANSETNRVLNLTVGEVLDPGAGILGPQGLTNVSTEDQAQPCYAIDLPPSLFLDIAPTAAELPYLLHSREVDVTNKEIQEGNRDGWFSVAVSNRFPTAGSKMYACLVSLEGWADYLPQGSKAGELSNYSAVRLFTLAYWTFTAETQATASFTELMQNMDSCKLKMPVTPKAIGQNTSPAAQLVTEALSDGYTPMTYEMRVGEKTVAWYRGPFSSVMIQPNALLRSFFSAEAALIYDKSNGMFDASYAVAWQIGRLLALSDRNFALGMLQWRKNNRQQQNDRLAKQSNIAAFQGLLSASNEEAMELSAVELSNQLDEFLSLRMANLVQGDEEGAPLILTRDPSGLAYRKAQLPGLVDQEELLKLLDQKIPLATCLRTLIFNQSPK
ncbi:MAG: hypothetical protein AAFP19_00025 [Bacteroidota bacterium]